MMPPFAAGDKIAIPHTCTTHDGVTVGPLVVEKVTPMGGITGEWRVRATRCDGSPVEVEVDSRGVFWTDLVPDELLAALGVVRS